MAILALLAIMPVYAEESNGFILLPPAEMAVEDAKRVKCQGGSNQFFSVGAMFVAFREALEACVIVAVINPRLSDFAVCLCHVDSFMHQLTVTSVSASSSQDMTFCAVFR